MIDRRSILLAAVSMSLVASLPAHAADRDPAALVAAVDELRLPGPVSAGSKISLKITDGNGAKQTVDHLTVLVRGDSSIVQMTDGVNRGMKVLGTPQGNRILWPNTRRAMRLTPVQQLRGQASVGDISRMRFAEDYTATFAPEKSATVGGIDCWVLALKAKSPASTYATITLHVAKSDGAPVEADVFVASGRKLKTVQFAPPKTIAGRRTVASVTYVDGIDATKKTTVEFLTAEPANPPAGMFKPEALPTDF